ncbi:MAG: DUF1566 domain-containing protein [bacterium]|nr:DUF1566 domain-containing protein [bacterium]
MAKQKLEKQLEDLKSRYLNTAAGSPEAKELREKIEAIKARIETLEEPSSDKPVIHCLRSAPSEVSMSEAPKAFNTYRKGWWIFSEWRPHSDIFDKNDFEVRSEVIIAHATGLVWQKSGSEEIPYEKSQDYIAQLNQERFAGYDDWRLPTIPELMSLLEPNRQSNKLYINPVFDITQKWCWSADKRSLESESKSAWIVFFKAGIVDWSLSEHSFYVRGVSSLT